MERQTFDKSRIKVYPFKTDDLKEQMVMEYSLNDHVLFPKPHKDVTATGWAEQGDGSYGEASKWFPHKVNNLNDAFKIHNDGFKFPMELKHKAESNAKKLYDAIMELGAPRTQRNTVQGRFDTRKSGKLWVDTHKGTFDLNVTRPFTQRIKTNPKRPHVAVLACGGWAELHGNGPDYIPDMSVAMMSVVWACQAIDCHVTSALCRNVMSVPGGVRHLGSLTVSSPEVCPSLGSFSGLLHTNMYRFGNTSMYSSHPDALKMTTHSHNGNETADSNTPAVQWARNHLGATMVIAVGSQFQDSSKADMVVQYHEVKDIDKLIDKIAEKIYRDRMVREFQNVAA